MKVKDLKAILDQCNDDDEVLLASDAEGNYYHPLYIDSINTYQYNWDGEYDAEIGLRKLTPLLEEFGYTEEDVMEGTPCIVFYP